MAEPRGSNFRHSYLIAAISMFLGWALVKGFEVHLSRYTAERLNQSAQIKRSEPDDKKEVLQPVLEDQSSYDYLLIESILSIVQNYYVDEMRVSNRELLSLALDRLQETGELIVSKSPGAVKIVRGEKSLTIDTSTDFDLATFVRHTTKISDLLIDKTSEKKPYGKANWLNEGRFKFLDSMLSALDPHSSLLNSFEYKELRQGTEGAFGGLGVVVGVKENLLTVIKPIPRSPAARAGIRKDDKIVKINDTSTFGATLDSLVEHMRGAPGTQVKLSLMRVGDYSPSEMSIKREVIQVDSVTATELKADDFNILHLAIENFSARTSREVKNLIQDSEKKHRIHGVILDLRGNPGGLLDQAVQVSDLFLRKGTIVSTKGRRMETESAGVGYAEFDYPLMVLINSDSASASEIVAGALKDNGRAIIIGQPSFGKGSVQTIFELPGDQALKLTIARYYTPNGISIQNRGIMPDVWVQPVVRGDANLNLLGPYRYRNERFLRHSLNSEGEDPSHDATYHLSYYLVDQISDTPVEDEITKDFEVSMATDLIKMISKSGSQPNPKNALKSPQHLEKFSRHITDFGMNKDSEAVRWLSEKYGIDWSAASGHQAVKSDDVVIDEVLPKTLEIGKNVSVDMEWRITNKRNSPIERSSIFVQVGTDSPSTFEFLVGKIPGNSMKVHKGSIPLYASKDQKKIAIRFGLSVDGMPIYFDGDMRIIDIIDGPVPELKALVRLVDDQGGDKPGVLEANEKGILSVQIENSGKRAADNISLSIVNLAGQQVSLSKDHDNTVTLDPGQSQEFRFPITASARIVNSEVGFGLLVQGSNLLKALKTRVTIPGLANSGEKSGVEALSH